MRDYIRSEITGTQEALTRVSADDALQEKLHLLAQRCVESLKAGGKILFAGNGGSAADAQHLAAELVGRLGFDRPAVAAIALTTDTSILTAVGNDYGYEHVFSRQIEALGNTHDVFIGISTSGNSANIIRALKAAKGKGLTTVGLTGKNGGALPDICDFTLIAPSDMTHHIQECHIVLGHILCGMIEKTLFGSGAGTA